MQREILKSYSDAIFHIKREFIIIGLTGFTGSGCTSARNILTRKDRPVAPGPPTGVNSTGSRNALIDRKLKNTWNSLEWNPFCAIEVSKVIFALACHEANTLPIRGNDTAEAIKSIITTNKTDLTSLEFLLSDKIGHEDAIKLIKAFEAADSLYLQFKKKVSNTLASFITIMQNLGDNIRCFAKAFPESNTPNPNNLFFIPHVIMRLIEAYKTTCKYKHFVIDAFRNPFEVEYFKRRYSEFYLIAINRDQNARRNSLSSLSLDEVSALETRERGSGIELSAENLSAWMTTQNITECIRKADMYVNNKEDKGLTYPQLRHALVKILTLAKVPGCIPPTDDERSMQMAMTGRQMSGCISRRVGATVLSQNGYIIGIGWNDPPSGQVPCSLRTSNDLIESATEDMFSEYERSAEFVNRIQTKGANDKPFCFRTEYGIIKNGKLAEYTRALHAEENALFQAMKNAPNDISNGTLYTTASTCNLCAKKAYELGIGRIVFIEHYPGIANQQTLIAGNRKIVIDQYDGVVGSAYHWLYESLMPEKDLIEISRITVG